MLLRQRPAALGAADTLTDPAQLSDTSDLEMPATQPCEPATAATGAALDDLEIATCGWVTWFNQERIHGELGDRTPAEVEAAHYRALAQANAA